VGHEEEEDSAGGDQDPARAGRVRESRRRGTRDQAPGDGCPERFDTRQPHWFGPANTSAVEILHLFGPRGDQAVVRAKPSASDPGPAADATADSTSS
jgi:hypothetical protein